MFTPHPAHLAPTRLPASPLRLAGPLTLCSGSQREHLSVPPSSAGSKPWRISAELGLGVGGWAPVLMGGKTAGNDLEGSGRMQARQASVLLAGIVPRPMGPRGGAQAMRHRPSRAEPAVVMAGLARAVEDTADPDSLVLTEEASPRPL